MKKVELSVIVPVYNVEQYIMRSYKSIVAQNYESYEIIYVNDGSTDNSLSILRNIESSDRKVKVIDIKHSGVAEARNIGINQASGKYIYFLDPDDYLLTGLFTKTIPMMDKLNADVLLFGMKEVFPNGREIIKSPLNTEILNQVEFHHKFPELYFHSNIFSPCNKLYRRDFIDKYNLYFPKVRVAEDAIFNIMLYRYVKKIIIINDVYYIYDKRQGSAMSSEPTRMQINQRFEFHMIDELNRLLNKEWNLGTNIPFYQRLDGLFLQKKYVNIADMAKLNHLYIRKFELIPIKKHIKYFVKYFVTLYYSIINTLFRRN